MIQDTSLDVYVNEIQPTLGSRQQLIFDELERNPSTNKDLAKKLNLPINSITPRVLELRNLNKVKQMYIDDTGKRAAIVWGINRA